jgi:hypothetical protein
LQALKGYLLKTIAVKEYLFPIRGANETIAPIPNDTFDCPLHKHLDYVRDLPDFTSTQVLRAKEEKGDYRRIFISEKGLIVCSKVLIVLEGRTCGLD